MYKVSWERLTTGKALGIWNFNRRCPYREEQSEHSGNTEEVTKPSSLDNARKILKEYKGDYVLRPEKGRP